jgi:hypothetical protein
MDFHLDLYSNHDAPSHSNKKPRDKFQNIVIVKNLSPLVKDLILFTKF